MTEIIAGVYIGVVVSCIVFILITEEPPPLLVASWNLMKSVIRPVVVGINGGIRKLVFRR